jgi:hypothetical protein
MLKKIKTEEFEEAVVTRPLEFRIDRALADRLRLFDEAPDEVVSAPPPTPSVKKTHDR